jgi:hypothetical protein
LWHFAHSTSRCRPSIFQPISWWSKTAALATPAAAKVRAFTMRKAGPWCSLWQLEHARTLATASTPCSPARASICARIGSWHFRQASVIVPRKPPWHDEQSQRPSRSASWPCTAVSSPGDWRWPRSTTTTATTISPLTTAIQARAERRVVFFRMARRQTIDP